MQYPFPGRLRYGRRVVIGVPVQPRTQVTMEEVWKEINLASLHKHRHQNIDHEAPPPSSSSTHHGSLLLPPATVPSLNPHSFDTHFDESARFGCFGKKRGQDSDESRGDRRHKRMTKNRESAARSRARKQAYTNELELEISHLQKENARLKRQEEQVQTLTSPVPSSCIKDMLKMAEATQHQTKRILQRSWTSPF